MQNSGAQTFDRGLTLLKAIVDDDGQTAVSLLAAQLGLALPGVRRMTAVLERHGLITRIAHGRYAAGPQWLAMAGRATPERRLIEQCRPLLRRLAAASGATAHLGVFEGEMVTYLAKEGSGGLFTREGGQLEAYCTGIGKALLAQLPPDRLEAYLRGTFIRLTPYTLTDPALLRAEIERTRSRGYALDDREMDENVACVAVPLPGNRAAAISLTGHPDRFLLTNADRIAARLEKIAAQIAARI